MQKNADALLKMGAKTVVIKGVVHEGEAVIRNYIASAEEGGTVEEVSSELLPYMLHGTGDLFASALTAAMHEGEAVIRNYIASAEEGGTVEEVSSELLPYMLHGTGDLFASALTAAIYAGRSTRDAVSFAGELVRDAMRVTLEQPDFEMRGVSFEPTLGKVAALGRGAAGLNRDRPLKTPLPTAPDPPACPGGSGALQAREAIRPPPAPQDTHPDRAGRAPRRFHPASHRGSPRASSPS